MSESAPVVDIILPTLDNPMYLSPCLNSVLAHTQGRDNIGKIIVVNNGSKEIESYITQHPLVQIVHSGSNLGWEGALKLGLQNSTAPFVCFLNDDTYIPYSSSLWLLHLLSEFRNEHVAAVGPTTNVCRGYQNIFLDQFAGYHSPFTSLLIFFCVIVKRADLDAAGGIDDTLPGGDDLDLCIRLTKLGKKLVICRDTFVYHHGFKTGERVRGGPDRPGGWNSKEMVEATNTALIRKHGFKAFIDCNNGGLVNPEDRVNPSRENETTVVSKLIKDGVIYELGCGASKTVPHAIGIDRVKLGDTIPFLEGAHSVADITADVTQPLPVPDASADTIIGRHVLEHCLDVVTVLRNWITKLTPTGRLIITVPDERIAMSIPMNPEHRHAFTPDSLKTLAELVGLREIERVDNYNGVSFTSVFEHAVLPAPSNVTDTLAMEMNVNA